MYRVREMIEKDIESVSALRVAGWRFAYRDLIPQSYLDGLSVRDDVPQRRMRFSDPRRASVNLVAVDGERVVGWLAFGPEEGRSEIGGVAALYALYVDPNLVGQGLGRLLMGEMHRRVQSASVAEVSLWVLEGNRRARGFYEAMGYHADGGVQAESYDGVSVDELRYVRPTLDPNSP